MCIHQSLNPKLIRILFIGYTLSLLCQLFYIVSVLPEWVQFGSPCKLQLLHVPVLSLTSCLSIESKHEVTILGGLNEFVVKFYGPQGSKYMCGYVFFLSSLLDSEVSFSTRTSMWRNPGHSCTHSHRFWVLSRWPQSCSSGSACSVLKQEKKGT